MANGTWRLARGRGSSNVPLLVASILAVLLLVAGKAHFLPLERARVAITDRAGPLFRVVNAPAVAVTHWAGGIGHFFTVYSENQQLRDENARLLQWRGAALALQDRVHHYQVLLKTVPELGYSAVTAEVIARSSQPFLETIILNAGQRNGVKAGQAVLDARGMLGRIYAAGDHTAWVILLTDLNSRVPVEIRPGNIPAILAGNNTAQPRLEALPQNAKLKSGADVVTSGDGGLLPAGLPVGLVSLHAREANVALYSDALTAAEVRVLNYRSPIEPMPKPTDRDLPAPDKLAPPAAPAQTAASTPQKQGLAAVHATVTAKGGTVRKHPVTKSAPRGGAAAEPPAGATVSERNSPAGATPANGGDTPQSPAGDTSGDRNDQ